MTGRIARVAIVAATMACLGPAPARAQKAVKPAPGAPGQWRLIGQTHADHSRDHDVLIVKGPYDNFRKIKFKVTDTGLNMLHMVVTYDNGAPDRIDVRQNMAKP